MGSCTSSSTALSSSARPKRCSIRPHRLPFSETFTASTKALRELAGYLRGSGSPPWDSAGELLADGLIDVHFALTPRGRRALAVHLGSDVADESNDEAELVERPT